MKLSQFVTMFALIFNKTKLPQFVTQTCPNLLYIYIFVITFCCSYYNLYELGWGYLTHRTELQRVTWLIAHVIMWYAKQSFSSTFARQWPPILARCDLIWVDHSHRVMWPIYHMIMLYSQKKYISNFTTSMTIKLGRVMSYCEGAPSTLSSNLSI